MYGAGQGFNEGVKTVGNFLFKAMEAKRADKQYYDRLALQQAWMDVYGGTPLQDGRWSPVPSVGVPRPQPHPPARSIGNRPAVSPPVPYQVTRPDSPAKLLAGQSFTHPNPAGYRSEEAEQEPAPRFTHPNPPSPAEALTTNSPQPSLMKPQAKTMVSTFRGPSPSSTPFSAPASSPHMEQRTFNAPKDPSMVIKPMPDVTAGPPIRRIGPNTPLPPISTMRSLFRRGY